MTFENADQKVGHTFSTKQSDKLEITMLSDEGPRLEVQLSQSMLNSALLNECLATAMCNLQFVSGKKSLSSTRDAKFMFV